MNEMMKAGLLRSVRTMILIFITGLVVSGVTAFPIETLVSAGDRITTWLFPKSELGAWLSFVHEGVANANTRYPFISYGTDWLAFAHIVIAVFFIGPFRDPVRNIWIVESGLVACAGIFPLAFIAGNIRGIPLYWQCIDCSFGLIGGMLLALIYKKIRMLKRLTPSYS